MCSDFVTDSGPEDQVKQFIEILRKPPYEIDITEDEEDSRTKYFVATKNGKIDLRASAQVNH